MLIKTNVLGGMISLTTQQGWAVFVSCLPIAIVGLISAVYQGMVASAAIGMVGRNAEASGKGIVMTVMVETYAVLALLAATVLVGLKTCQPTHTGDLTVRKFAENYDYIHSTEGLLSRELYDDGTWAPATQLGFQVIHHTKNVPNLSYTTKDGSLIDISLHMGAEACTSPVYGLPFRELYLTMLAFDGARTAASADEALAAAARQLLDEPLQELHTQAAGYQIDYSLTMTGFTGLAEDGSLELPRNTTGSYTLSFDMRKLDG